MILFLLQQIHYELKITYRFSIAKWKTSASITTEELLQLIDEYYGDEK